MTQVTDSVCRSYRLRRLRRAMRLQSGYNFRSFSFFSDVRYLHGMDIQTKREILQAVSCVPVDTLHSLVSADLMYMESLTSVVADTVTKPSSWSA